MKFTEILKLDLAGRFNRLIQNNRGALGTLDLRNVYCLVTVWKHDNRIDFSAGINLVSEFEVGQETDFLRFYEKKCFSSRIEAMAHEEAQIRRASRLYTRTRFHRERPVSVMEHGKLLEKEVIVQEYCLDGVWYSKLA
ncbi:hypothetical protein [Maritalea myrionectae]|uniref:hypothetical protein n=1 Tax=Maritalea myrionectae TaxID=454601 RepID=UPI0004852FD9|nr:hypothetical protein [Maritalea myrionectae]